MENMYMLTSDDENLTKRVSVTGGLQGPRPPALKIGKDSYKIKKQQSTQTTRPPPVVIIHLKSPEIIHTRPQDFRGIVQQLTGMPKSLAQPTTTISPMFGNMMVQDCKRYEFKDLNNFDRDLENLQVMEDLTLMNVCHGSSPSTALSSTISPKLSAGLLLQSPNANNNNWLDHFGPIY